MLQFLSPNARVAVLPSSWENAPPFFPPLTVRCYTTAVLPSGAVACLLAWCGMLRLVRSCSSDRSSSQKPRVQSTNTQHLNKKKQNHILAGTTNTTPLRQQEPLAEVPRNEQPSLGNSNT